jgi:hypothetical protein
VLSFMAFYERGFGMPPHRFLHSLLRHYNLELHHLTLLDSTTPEAEVQDVGVPRIKLP